MPTETFNLMYPADNIHNLDPAVIVKEAHLFRTVEYPPSKRSEIGIPFSDPIADGSTIQASTFRALGAGTSPKIVFDILYQIRKQSNCPIIILSYFNPIMRMGIEKFVEKARHIRVDGFVIPDLPLEESSRLWQYTSICGIDLILFAAPSTSLSRLNTIMQKSSGFLYLVSVHGVTGERDNIQQRTVDLVREFSSMAKGRIPIAVGFGISKPEHIRTVISSGAEGVIIGSAFINVIDTSKGNPNDATRRLRLLAASFKSATAYPS